MTGVIQNDTLCCVWHMTGVYSAESLTDCSWLCMSLGLIFFYHFVILQGLGLVLSTILFYSRPIAPTSVKYNYSVTSAFNLWLFILRVQYCLSMPNLETEWDWCFVLFFLCVLF